MKLTVMIIIGVLAFLYIGGVSISFKPFSFSVPYWYRSVAMLLMWMALIVYNVGEHTTGYKKGLSAGSDQVINILTEKGYGDKCNKKD